MFKDHEAMFFTFHEEFKEFFERRIRKRNSPLTREKPFNTDAFLSSASYIALKDVDPWVVGKLGLTIGNTLDLIIDTLGDRANAFARDLVVLALVADAADRRHHSGSTSTESLKNTALVDSLGNFSHGVVALTDLEFLPAASKLDSAATSDTRKNHIGDKRASDELLLALLIDPEDEEVHGTDLSDLVVEEPENLVVALLGSLSLRDKSDGVVTTNLVATTASGPGTAVLTLVAQKLDWLPAGGIVGTDRAEDNKDLCLLGESNTNGRVGGDVSGADVKREALTLWDPILIVKDELLDASQETLRIDGGETHTLSRAVHTSHVELRAEHARTTVRTLESLHAFEALDSIVEDRSSRAHLEVVEGNDARDTPAFLEVPINFKHVIAEILTEHESGLLGLGLGACSVLLSQLSDIDLCVCHLCYSTTTKK